MECITTESERAYKRRYYQKNKESKKEYQKRYCEKNKEKVRVYQKKYSMTHDRSEYFRHRYLRKKAEKVLQKHSEPFPEVKLVSVDKVEGEPSARVI